MKNIILLLTLGLLGSAQAASYSTNFPNVEAPLSEGGVWIQGQVVGNKWRNVNSLQGMAYGTQTGSGNYDDSTALLTGTWGADQTGTATAVVRTPVSGIAEIEIRLRSSLSLNKNSGYEFNWSVSDQAYCQIVRWNGAVGDFTLLDSRTATIRAGDTVKATAIGNTLTTYVNGKAVFSVTDSTFKGGSPGIGFYVTDGANNQSFGLTNFNVSDGTSPTPTPTPTATPSPTVAPTPTPNPTPAPTPRHYRKWNNKWSQWIKDNPVVSDNP